MFGFTTRLIGFVLYLSTQEAVRALPRCGDDISKILHRRSKDHLIKALQDAFQPPLSVRVVIDPDAFGVCVHPSVRVGHESTYFFGGQLEPDLKILAGWVGIDFQEIRLFLPFQVLPIVTVPRMTTRFSCLRPTADRRKDDTEIRLHCIAAGSHRETSGVTSCSCDEFAVALLKLLDHLNNLLVRPSGSTSFRGMDPPRSLGATRLCHESVSGTSNIQFVPLSLRLRGQDIGHEPVRQARRTPLASRDSRPVFLSQRWHPPSRFLVNTATGDGRDRRTWRSQRELDSGLDLGGRPVPREQEAERWRTGHWPAISGSSGMRRVRMPWLRRQPHPLRFRTAADDGRCHPWRSAGTYGAAGPMRTELLRRGLGRAVRKSGRVVLRL